MWIIVIKELKELLYSPKFIFIFIAATLLILTSVFNGYLQYSEEHAYVEAKTREAHEDFVENRIHSKYASITIYRKPGPLSVFDMGVSGLIGRMSHVTAQSESNESISFGSAQPRISDQKYSQHPVLALFGDLNLSFVVSAMLSLFAILLSYNAICGERENGTLSLVFSNTISRSTVYLGKFFGGLIPLYLLFIIPFVFSLLGLLLLTDVQFAAAEWAKLLMMTGAVLLFLTLFFVVGLASSALTKSSFVSFMICLLVWIFALAIVPRFSMQAARAVSPPMSSNELNTRKWIFFRQLWRNDRKGYYDFIEKNVITKENQQQKMQEYYQDIRKEQQVRESKFSSQLWQEYRRRRQTLAQTAATYSRLSPISCLQFTVHSMTGTGHDLIDFFEDTTEFYGRIFQEYAEKIWVDYEDTFKQEKPRQWKAPYKFITDESGFVRVKIDKNAMNQFTNNNPQVPIDRNSIPEFSLNHLTVAEASSETLIDLALIFIYAVIYFCVGFVAFLRYDLRS